MADTLTPQQEERDACMQIIVDEWMRAQKHSSITEVINRITERIMARGPIPQRRFCGVPLEEIPDINAFADRAKSQ